MTAPARWVDLAVPEATPTLRVTVSPLPIVEPMALFAQRGVHDGVYWAQPSAGRFVAGIGTAAAFHADGPDRLKQAAAWWRRVLASADVTAEAGAPAAPLCFGGASFDPLRSLETPWQPFGGAWFVVPALTFLVDSRGAWLVSAEPADGSRIGPAELWPAERTPSSPTPARCVADSAAAFCAGVRQAVEEIERRRYDKLVLARQVVYTRRPRFDTLAAIARLQADYPTCTTFAFARGEHVFLGATPERLVRLNGRELQTMCLAGSAPRGADAVDDARQAAALLADEKERYEHAVVVAAMREALAPLCDEVVVPDEPVVSTLPYLHHLQTSVIGWLRPTETILTVVDELHPSPAVGGAPREAALAAIRRYEGFDRGWFAGPVGWLDGEGGDFVVALRSALVATDKAWLFAGCGVVASSNPDRELRETDLKLLPMRVALEVERR